MSEKDSARAGKSFFAAAVEISQKPLFLRIRADEITSNDGSARAGTADALEICMKASRQFLELSLCIVCALAPSALFTLRADSVAVVAPANAVREIERESIQGDITAKTESNLTVNERLITTTATTACRREGKLVTFADLRIGEKVKVTAEKAADGSLQAVTVEVMSESPTPPD